MKIIVVEDEVRIREGIRDLIDMLEDCDDVQEVYHNGEISDEVAATL